MCGLLALIGCEVAPQAVSAALALMDHRGPDARRIVQPAHGVTFGFTRLAIIDLDPRSCQPIVHGPVTLMMNGEVYNYVELRRRLAEDGVEFATSGDGEVMAAAMHHWGVDRALQEARGMWGMVAYDARDDSITIARDRLGIKPLYWARHPDGGLVIASEPKVILALIPQLRQLDRLTLGRYLVAGALEQHDRSFYEGIHPLPKAHAAIVRRDGGMQLRRYWALSGGRRSDLSIPAVKDCLDETMALHLRADVPIGVALSGGFDSTLITAYLRGRSDIRYYSVAPPAKESEAPIIDATVREWGLDHRYVDVADDELAKISEWLITTLDQPFKTAQSIYQMAMRQQAAKDGVRAFLTGDGADEVFAGYENCVLPMLAGLLRHGQWSVALRLASQLTVFSRRPASALLRSALRRAVTATLRPSPVEDLRRRPEAALVEPALVAGLSVPEQVHRAGDLKSHLIYRLQVEGVPYWLRIEDGLSMAVGIETRVPFLDHVLVELGLGFPDDEYFNGGRNKSILRRAAAGMLPPTVERETRKFMRPGSTRHVIFTVLWRDAADLFSSSQATAMLVPGAVDRFLADREAGGQNEGFWFRAWLALRWAALCLEGGAE